MQSRIPTYHHSVNPPESPSPSPTTAMQRTQSSNVGSNSPAQLARSGSVAGSDMNLSDTRKRQNKRDEAIRKKIENDLAKKRGTPKRPEAGGGPSRPGRPSRRQQQAGTVSALRPTPALTVPSHISVADASQLCAAKRTDCVLVVDEDEHLCGIFTAKDLAFRVTGEGLDPRNTRVETIMTPNPMVTRDTTSATDALQTMVTRHFRHLPVCNEEGDVVGLLDITKVFNESLEKLERAYGSSQKLYTALEGVQSEWGANSNSQSFGGAGGLMSYVEALREKMSFPTLDSILDARTEPITVSVKTSVREAARLMREHRTTAVCVMEDTPVNGQPKLAGIFTSKDIVLRVIAAGLDAKTCSVVRVMTPHPDTGSPALTIQGALRKMHDGHFLNLPVVEEDGTLVGCVDVLKLTYATLEQVSSIGADSGSSDAAGGPLWSKFFSSFAGAGSAGGDDDTQSVLSDSQAPTSSVAPGTPSAGMPNLRHLRQDSAYGIPPGSPSEIHPNDSASVLHDDDDSDDEMDGKSGLGKRLSRKAAQHVKTNGTSTAASAAALPSPPPDDGTYLFKFLSPSGTTHRFVARYSAEEGYSMIRDIITGKLSSDPFFTSSPSDGPASPSSTDYTINYTDDDGDLVLLSSDSDLIDSVKTARAQGKDRVLLIIKGGKGWEDSAVSPAKQTVEEAKKTEDIHEALVEKEEKQKSKKSHDDGELVLGFLQKDMVLPAAVAFLGVCVVGVFALSRTSK